MAAAKIHGRRKSSPWKAQVFRRRHRRTGAGLGPTPAIRAHACVFWIRWCQTRGRLSALRKAVSILTSSDNQTGRAPRRPGLSVCCSHGACRALQRARVFYRDVARRPVPSDGRAAARKIACREAATDIHAVGKNHGRRIHANAAAGGGKVRANRCAYGRIANLR